MGLGGTVRKSSQLGPSSPPRPRIDEGCKREDEWVEAYEKKGRTRRRLRFLGAGTRPETGWPIKGASSRSETVTADPVADGISDTRVRRGKLGEGSEEAVRVTQILIGLLGTKATGLERARSKKVQEGGRRVGG